MYDLKSGSVSHPSLIPAFFCQKRPDLLATNSLTKVLKMFRLQCNYIYVKCKYIVAPYFVCRDESLHGNGGRSGTVTSGQSRWKRPKGE